MRAENKAQRLARQALDVDDFDSMEDYLQWSFDNDPVLQSLIPIPGGGLVGAVKQVGALKSISNSVKSFFGKGYPTKTGYMGRQQPFDPTTGRYLSPSANPGLIFSTPGQFSTNFLAGFAESATGVQAPPAVSRIGSISQTAGKYLGQISSLFN